MANSLVWADIPVADLDRAISFYSKMLNVEMQKQEMEGAEFSVIPHLEGEVSACLYKEDDMSKIGGGALIYLNAEGRLHEIGDISRELGVVILKEMEQIGPYGFRTIITDCEGNSIAFYSSVKS